MSKLKKVNAILLAGDRSASIQVCDDNKAFLLLKERPLLVHILRTLQQAESVQDIVLIGPKERLCDLVKIYASDLNGEGDIRVIEQRENMIENFKAAYIETLELPPDTEFSSLRKTNYAEIPVLVVPCDIPLLTPWELDEFITDSEFDRFDYSIGITSEKVLSHYHPTETQDGIQMIYFHLKEDLMRHNNLHLAKPLHFEHLDYIEKMYEWRYQTHWANALRMALSLLWVSWRFLTAIRVFVMLQLSLYYDRHGHPRISDHIRMHAPLKTFQRGIGNILGAKTQLVYTHFGGAALDVDHDENLKTLEAMYDEWMAYQRENTPLDQKEDTTAHSTTY